MTKDEIRKEFEDAVFHAYFVSSIKLNKTPNPRAMGTDRLIVEADKTQVEFCRRGSDGYYVDDTLNAAWWAWEKASTELHARLDRMREAVNKVSNSMDATWMHNVVQQAIADDEEFWRWI